MSLSPGERINKIRESATLLDKQDWDHIDLVLQQHGLPTSDFDLPGTKTAYVVKMLRDATDDSLTQLHGYLSDEAVGEGRPGQSPWTGRKLRLFCSHLAEHKAVVGAVGEQLSAFGVEPFIAHDSIEPSKQWMHVIESALDDCDAMIVFLHTGFDNSRWCDQEVGWALGRKRPILALNYGIHPYGFLGKHQDQPCAGAYAGKVAGYVMDWLTKTPSLHGRLGHGLVAAFVDSYSWNFTRSLVPYLDRIASLDDDDLSRMEVAARDNIDVSACVIPPGTTGPEWVQAFVAKRRGPAAAPLWPASDEPPF